MIEKKTELKNKKLAQSKGNLNKKKPAQKKKELKKNRQEQRTNEEFVFLVLKAIGLVLLGALCYAIYVDNPKYWAVTCPSMYMRHLKCPFCGNLTAFHHLFHGDIMEALAKNAMGMVITVVLLLMLFIPACAKNKYLITFVIFSIIMWTLARAFAKYEFFSDLLAMFGF